MIITVTPSSQTVSPAQTTPYSPLYLAGWNPATNQYDPTCQANLGDMERLQESQHVEYFRSPNALEMDRGNVSYHLPFSVALRCGTVDAALLVWMQQMANCPTSGLVTLYGQADNGQQPILWLPNCVVKIKAPKPGTGTVYFAYDLYFGSISFMFPS